MKTKDRAHRPFGHRSVCRAILISVYAVWCTPIVTLAQEDAVEEKSPEEEVISEIVVTGSYIGRSPFDAPSPVTQIGSDLIEAASIVSLDDLLAKTPALNPGVGLSNQSIGQDSGAAFANLRGLGTNRTLTLINGRRQVPGNGFNSAVDINTIPPSMIERVEVVTGGTAAIYGADSIAGVINIILKDDWAGVELSGKVGMPTESPGGESQILNLLLGAPFAEGRGNFGLAFSYGNYNGFDNADRSYARGQRLTTLRVNSQNTGPNDGIPDTILVRDPRIAIVPSTGSFLHNGFFRTVDENGLRFLEHDWAQTNPDGTLADIYTSGGDGLVFEEIRPLRTSLERFAIYNTYNYDFTQDLEGYLELNFSFGEGRNKDEVPIHGLFDRPLFVTRDNPLLHPELTDYMDANGLTSLFVGRSAVDLGRFKTVNDRNFTQIVAGLRGSIDSGGIFDEWTWDISAQYGRNSVMSSFQDAVFRDRLYQAYDVIADPVTGEPVCRDPGARAAGCLPLHAIGPVNDISDPQFRSWLFTDTLNKLTTDQSILSGIVSGDLFSLPAGNVQAALGMSFRKETLNFEEDPAMEENRIYELGLFLAQSSRSGEQQVGEVFAEVLVPIFSERSFADQLSIEGSVRQSRYDTFGNTLTWKGGLVYAPIEDIRFRATASKSVRAPSINELFSPGTPSSFQVLDPCDVNQRNLGTEFRDANCNALGIPPDFMDSQGGNTIINTGGNLNLDAETSESWTAGLVVTPRFLDNLSLSVDAYEIDLEGAISSTSVSTIITQCVDLPTINNIFCPLVHRDPVTKQMMSIDNQLINFGNRLIRGVDWQALYSFDAPNFLGGADGGSILVSLNGSRLLEATATPDPNQPQNIIIVDGELMFPKTRLNAYVAYNRGPLNASWFTNYIGSTVVDRQPTSLEQFPQGLEGVEAEIYHYFNLEYQFNERYSASFSINNVFNDPPPAHPSITGSGNFGGGRGLYDNQGRVYFVGGRVSF